MTSLYTCRWGIMATGGIARVFAADLLIDPSTRSVTDIKHFITAVASSSSVQKAKDFVSSLGIPSSAAVYDNYDSLVNDPNVDIIYVATPHSHHFAHCLLALRAGKHVVCEKPFTVNAPQLKILIDLAKEKGLFLMEAVWTRFFPLSQEVRRIITSGEIGEVRKCVAELGLQQDPETLYAGENVKHRMVNPDLAGGALLDLGVYALTWVFQTLYHTLSPEERKKAIPKVTGAIQTFAPTGVDVENVVLLTFPGSIGVASSGMCLGTDPDDTQRTGITIYGTKGQILVSHPAYRPTRIEVVPGEKGKKVEKKEFDFPGGGHGMFWEADGAARCVRDGKKECETIPLQESLLIMEAMDKVREEAGFRYPEALETLKG